MTAALKILQLFPVFARQKVVFNEDLRAVVDQASGIRLPDYSKSAID